MANHKKRERLYCVPAGLVKPDVLVAECLLMTNLREPEGSRFYPESGLCCQCMLRHIPQQRTNELNALWTIAQILHEFQTSRAIKAIGARIAL